MNDADKSNWVPLLQRLNDLMRGSVSFSDKLSEEAIATGWCGGPPATEDEINAAETRLGVKLPPSYRSFLLVSNGWRPFNSFVERLLPIETVDRYCILDAEDFAVFDSVWSEPNGEVSDEVYLDYDSAEHSETIRPQYYANSLLVGKRWEGSGDELVLLNPHIVSKDGEWETIFFASWLPGNKRFRSFRDFLEDSLRGQERIEASLLSKANPSLGS